MKERLIRGYRNLAFEPPYHQTGEYLNWLILERSWTNEQFLAELQHVKMDEIVSFFPLLLNQVHIEVLAHGNLYKEDVLRMTTTVENILKPRCLPESQWSIRRSLVLPEGGDFTYRRQLVDPAQLNNCIQYYLHFGSVTDKKLRAKALLLAQISAEPAFNQLRTKEQLGYVVFTGFRVFITTLGYHVMIQSERSPEYLEGRINAFLAAVGRDLKAMSDKDFEAHRRSVINKRLEKVKNLGEETERFWAHITNEYFDFRQRQGDIDSLKALTKSEMEEFFDQYVHPIAPRRAKLSVYLVAHSSIKAEIGNMTPVEQKVKVLDALTKYLTVHGIGVDDGDLAKAFENVDILQGNATSIIQAVSSYLELQNVPEQQKTQILEQGKQLLGTVLPGFGIEVKLSEAESDELEKPPKVKETTIIENVAEFKASLPASAGPRPVVDLSIYEDLEPKL